MTKDSREVIEWLRRPPLSFVARLVYRLLFHAAYLTLPLPYQKMIGLRAMPHWLVVPTTRLLLRLIRLAIGSGNPIQEAAIVRLNRQAV